MSSLSGIVVSVFGSTRTGTLVCPLISSTLERSFLSTCRAMKSISRSVIFCRTLLQNGHPSNWYTSSISSGCVMFLERVLQSFILSVAFSEDD